MSTKKRNIRPFLKWPGRKYQVFHLIDKHLVEPDEINMLVEPFLGSATVFLNTGYKYYHLNDNNEDLINTYLYLTKEGEKFVKYCLKYFNDENNAKSQYYELREEFNSTRNKRKKAALFIYLNRHGYNGLCRYNSSGIYNVPFGSYKKINLPYNEMMQFHEKVSTDKVIIDCTDYKETLTSINNPAVVYCDPPYVPLSTTSSFTKYSKSDFNLDEHHALTELMRELKINGISSCVSNHDMDITRDLYHDAKIVSFDVRRSISCQSSNRKHVKELLAIYEHE